MSSLAAEFTQLSLANAGVAATIFRDAWRELVDPATSRGAFGISLPFETITRKFGAGNEMAAISWLRKQEVSVTLKDTSGDTTTETECIAFIAIAWPRNAAPT